MASLSPHIVIRQLSLDTRQFSCIVLLFLALLSPAFGQSVDWARVHARTLDGINKLYNLDIDGAGQSFDQVIAEAPNDPRGWFFKSMVEFYVYQLTQDQTAYTRFFELSETVIDKAEAFQEKNPQDPTAKFYLGGIYGYRGLAYQRNGNIVSAVWDGRKGYSFLKEAATGPRFSVDAQMGFGLFSYLISRIPRTFSWMLGIIGFSGDREGGLAMVRSAAENGVYTRTEASFYYATFCFFEERYDEAYASLRRLIAVYPNNALFLTTLASWELRRDHIDEAIAAGERSIAIAERLNLKVGDDLVYSTLASAYYARNDFARAAEKWEISVSRTENGRNLTNNVYYRLGIAYEITGRRDRAIATWNRMNRTNDMDKPWESVYWRRAQLLIANPMTASDIAVVVAANLAQSGQWASARDVYARAIELAGNDQDRRAVAQYNYSNASLQCSDDATVITLVPEILRLHLRTESWVAPHALFVLGQAYARANRTDEARRAFDQALGFSKYDWEVNLRGRIERERGELSSAK